MGGVTAVVVSQPSYLKALAAMVNELPVDRWKPYLKASLLKTIGSIRGLSAAVSPAEVTEGPFSDPGS